MAGITDGHIKILDWAVKEIRGRDGLPVSGLCCVVIELASNGMSYIYYLQQNMYTYYTA